MDGKWLKHCEFVFFFLLQDCTFGIGELECKPTKLILFSSLMIMK